MSHISKINLEVNNLPCLEKAVKKLGGTFHKNKTEFSYYAGRKGKCLHAASFPNCSFDLGIIKGENNDYVLQWDSYSSGGLSKVLGENANKLKQTYAVEVAKNVAKMQGYIFTEKTKENGVIELKIMVN